MKLVNETKNDDKNDAKKDVKNACKSGDKKGGRSGSRKDAKKVGDRHASPKPILKPKTAKARLGSRAEFFVYQWGIKQGWIPLMQNFRTRYGEIDLIFEVDKTVIFVEVRCRSRWTLGRPVESVNRGKQDRLRKAALLWLQKYRNLEQGCRFDVCEVRFNGTERRLVHWENAF